MKSRTRTFCAVILWVFAYYAILALAAFGPFHPAPKPDPFPHYPSEPSLPQDDDEPPDYCGAPRILPTAGARLH